MSAMTTVDLAANDWTLAVTSDGSDIAVFVPGTAYFCVSATKPENVPPAGPAMLLDRGKATSINPDNGDKVWLYWVKDGEGGATLTASVW